MSRKARIVEKIKRHPKGSLLLVLLCLFFFVDWVLVDLWQIRGRVVDEASGNGIPNSWILANFRGEKPLFRLPIPPHPSHRTGACMGAQVTRTNDLGEFSIKRLSVNRALANKDVSIFALKPGWVSNRSYSAISSSLLGWPPSVSIQLEQPRRRRSHASSTDIGSALALPAHQQTYSNELTSTLILLSEYACGRDGFELYIHAMNHALSIAQTFNERERVMAWCRYSERQTAHYNLRRVEKLRWFLHSEPEYVWPFDCENLPFKHQPSAEVLAVEAELAAKRSGQQVQPSKDSRQ